MKKLAVLIFLLIGFQPVFAQNGVERFIKKMYANGDTTKKPSYILVPSLSSSPETGLDASAVILVSFYSDTTAHNITRVSNIYDYGSVTAKGQERTGLDISYWAPLNTWHYTFSSGFMNYPFSFYGIGNNTSNANKETIEEKRTIFNIAAQKQLTKNFYAGLQPGIFKYYYYSGTYTQNIPFKTDPEIQDHGGGSGVYIGPVLTFDSRNNNTYTTKGLMISAYYNLMQGIYANNGYEGGLFSFKYAEFFTLNRKLVLGLNVEEQSLTGYRSPFYLLPQLGSDALMRGYYTGRYRDRNLIAGQAELRYRIWQRFGVVGFLGTGEVANKSFSAAALKPDYGGGLRYFFDIEKGLSLRADYGIGEKPAGESRESGLYLALGEAF